MYIYIYIHTTKLVLHLISLPFCWIFYLHIYSYTFLYYQIIDR